MKKWEKYSKLRRQKNLPACGKDSCGKPHHHLLHYNVDPNWQVQLSEKLSNVEAQTTPQNELVTHIKMNNYKVLLKTVPVDIHGPNGVVSTFALLDDGSTVSLISAALASKAGLQGCKQTMRLGGAWNNSELVCESEVVNSNISNKDGTIYSTRVRRVNELNLPMQNLSAISNINDELMAKVKCS